MELISLARIEVGFGGRTSDMIISLSLNSTGPSSSSLTFSCMLCPELDVNEFNRDLGVTGDTMDNEDDLPFSVLCYLFLMNIF